MQQIIDGVNFGPLVKVTVGEVSFHISTLDWGKLNNCYSLPEAKAEEVNHQLSSDDVEESLDWYPQEGAWFRCKIWPIGSVSATKSFVEKHLNNSCGRVFQRTRSD